MKMELDVHTHTIASGHAYGTLTEMAKAASEKGLALLGITEHTHYMPGACDDIYFNNLRVVPREMFGMRLMLGAELNIMDYKGRVDLPVDILRKLDVRIASIHGNLYRHGTKEENTAAILAAMANPYIDIIGHPDDGNCPLDYERLVRASKECHTLLEINNNSMRMPWRKNVRANILTILRLCKDMEVPVILGSDAHYMTDIANMNAILPLIAEAEFPERLIMNYSVKQFVAYIAYNHKHEPEE